jgi:hypothetical protein
MAKRSREEWAALIKQQPASGLTITAFCRQHKLGISRFYARKSNKAKIKTVTPFVKATVVTPTEVKLFVKAAIVAPTEVTPQIYASQQTICLQHQTGLWTFPSIQE